MQFPKKKRLNILISAHEISPYQGSECAEGWNIIKVLAQNKQLNIIVIHAQGSQYSPNSYKDAIGKYYQKNVRESNLTFISIKQPKLTLLIAKINQIISGKSGSIGFPVFYFWGYTRWQKRVYKTAKELTKNQQIDLIHHLTQITFREPGFLWKLNIPFVWGPMGGIKGLPYRILKELSFKQKIFEIIRNASNLFQLHIKRRTKFAIKCSKLIYTFSKEDFKIVSKFNPNVKIMLDSGTSQIKKTQIRRVLKSEKLKIMWAGQLIERKALILLIKALDNIEKVNDKVEVSILGDGPLKNYYINEVKNRSLSCVRFFGNIEHKAVTRFLTRSHVFIHTSYREATTHVVPEALSTGLPIICHDSFGLSIVVTKDCGIKVPLNNFNTSINGFSQAIERILNEPNIIQRLSKGAILRSHELSWKNMGETIFNDYKAIIENNEKITYK